MTLPPSTECAVQATITLRIRRYHVSALGNCFFLLLILWASVACSTKPAGENAEVSATSHIFGREQVTLPAGTVVTVRLASAVGSKLSATGEHFSATVARPVEVDGKVVVPPGTEALGKIVEAVPQGRFKRAAVLRLVLETVTVKDDSYDVKTSSVSRGAGGGALIGGITGGGKGALIGAALGAGAGTAGAAYTGEKEIVLPAESTLSFKLAHPLTVRM